MFGGAKPAFGQTSTTPAFGFNNTATASPFGQNSAFGKPAAQGAFGQTSSFGQTTNQLFGNNQQAGGGLFGAAPNAAPAFGAPATTQSGFGAFGQQQQQQQQQQPTSLFGAPPNTNANTSLFGNNNNSAFGAAKPPGFGFGATNTQTSLFGQASTSNTSTSGFFGQNTNTGGGGLFGAAKPAFGGAVAGTANGTAIAKYQQTHGSDTLVKNGQTTSVNTKQHCITFMKEYESRSVEELRIDDYLANRKGPQAGAVGNSMFGQTAPSTGLFGATVSQPSLFGQTQQQQPQQSTGLFGTNQNTFGQTTAPAFGATAQPAAGGLFGKPFTATPATTASTFGFGTTNTTTLGLGANKPFGATTPGMFGQQPAATNNFGQTSFGAFGTTTQTQPTSLFGGAATNTVAPAQFGLGAQTANPSGFGFGTNANANTAGGGLFGAKPANTFGTMNTFGNPVTSAVPTFGNFAAPNNTGLYSTFNKPAAPSFGLNTQTAAGTLGGGLTFGAGNNSLFGNNAAKPAFGTVGTGGLFGTSQQMGTSLQMGTNNMGFGGNNFGNVNVAQAAVPIHQQILAMATSPYGDNPIFKDLKPISGPSADSLKPTNPSAQKAILEGGSNQFKVSPKVGSGVRIKPVGSSLSKKSLFEGLEEYDSTLEESFSLKPNAKRLIIKAKTSSTANISLQSNKTANDTSILNSSNRENTPKQQQTPETFQNQIPINPIENNDTSRRVSWLQSNALDKVRQTNRMSESILENTIKDLVTGKENIDKNVSNVSTNDSVSPTTKQINEIASTSSTSPQMIGQTSTDSFLSNRSYMNDTTNQDSSLAEDIEPHLTGITLKRAGYYTLPSLDDILLLMDDEGRCVVPNFTIGRKGYGNVYFNEPIDVAGLNLDEIVHFRHKEVIIYPDDENKPPVGSGLNRKAQITLDQVWPHDKALHEPIKDPERLAMMDYEGKLRRVCDKHDTRYLEYRPDTGSWVFKVDHFSKYGLSDSDEDEAPIDPKKVKLGAQAVSQTKSEVGMKQSKVTAPKSQEGAVGQTFTSRDSNFLNKYGYFNDDNMNLSIISDNLGMPPTSPSDAIAKDMGTDSHKLQLMKASFFVDDDYDGRSVMSDTTSIGGRPFTPDQMVPNKPMSRGLSSEISMIIDDLPIPAGIQIEGKPKTKSQIVKPVGPKSMPLYVEPTIKLVTARDLVLPMKQSLLAQVLGSKKNLAFFNGRKFKVGWSFPNVMVQLNTVNNCNELKKEHSILELSRFLKGRDDQDYSPAAIQMFQIHSANMLKTFEEAVEDHLEVQLKHDLQNKVDGSDCPYFVANGKHAALEAHHNVSRKNFDNGTVAQFRLTVWGLCSALWGKREELEDVDENNHTTTMFRRDLFSEWIEGVITEKNTIIRKDKSDEDYLDHLLELICSHKVFDACELAFQNDDVNLALLLSQLSGGPTVRQLMQHQLSSWQDVEADKFISEKRLKAFMLVAGIPLLTSTHGIINVFDDLDWLKALALQLWYLCSPTSSITDALLNYEKSFEADDFYAAPPTPPYNDQVKTKSQKPLQDIRFHLLKLYSKRSHPIEALLNPATHTSDPMDFRLSWFLMQVLETLGYHHCSELARSQIHVSFASQLENYGMWHWSIYILLHINDQSRRELTIQDMIYRHIELSDNDDYLVKENFITKKLGIPEKWIYWAKAVRAGAQNDHHEQAKYLLAAKQWSLAHDVIIQHIAPDCIIKDDVPYLKNLLHKFEDTKAISNWSIKGQILHDFIELNEKFDLIKEAIDDDVELRLEAMKPKLSELCSVIKMFPCPTPKHRLCQSEIAQRLANLIRSFFTSDPQVNACAIMRIALEKLPLPQEYAQEQLRHMLNAFLTEELRIN